MDQHHQISQKPTSFFLQLKKIYTQYKQAQKNNSRLFETRQRIKKRDEIQQKTKSKSRKKKVLNSNQIGQTRKSQRLNTQIGRQTQFMQIDREPIWQIKKRKKQISLERKPTKVQLNKFNLPKTNKIKSTNPLYEFYSSNQYQLQQNQVIQQKSIVDFQKNTQLQDIQMENQGQPLEQSVYNQEQLKDWNPTKKQSSMLSIQKIIDQYMMFQSVMRNSQVAKLSDLFRYVREIKGYYFNLEVLHEMLSIHKQLYKVFTVERQKHIKSCRLTQLKIQKRLLMTKIKMKQKKKTEIFTNKC